MTPSAFLLEVVVGELTLTHHPLHRYHPVASSPTVCIKVEAGPSLLIPFLPPAFTNILGEAGTEDGRYIFQRGKSSIFSSSSQLLGGDKGSRVKVEVLSCGGGRGGQPAVLGRCDALMVPLCEASMHLGLRGKLVLVGEKGEAVGHVSLSLSLRCLGKVASAGADWELPGGKKRSYTTSGVPSTIPHYDPPPSDNIAFKIASPQDPKEPFLGEGLSPQTPGEKKGKGGLTQPPGEKGKGGLTQPPGKKGKGGLTQPPGETGKGGLTQPPGEKGKGGLTQPSLILFSGKDKEEVALMRQNKTTQTQEDQHRHTNRDKSDKSGQGSHGVGEGSTQTPSQQQEQKRKARNTHHPPTATHRHFLTHPPLARPQGWLRSTPPAPTAPSPPPRLNRSHLLRLAAANPQLGQNLRAEVERQVKDKVKGLEADFLQRIEKLAAKNKSQRMSRQTATATAATTTCRSESVGCQTEDVTLTSRMLGGRKRSQEAPSSQPPPSAVHHHQAPPTQAHPSPTRRHPNTNSNNPTQTGKHTTAATHSPKETKLEKKSDKHSNTRRERGAEVAPASSASEGADEKARVSGSRIRLGQMPKNVTYVIGPDGERVYGDSVEVLPQKEEEEEERGNNRRGRQRGGVRSEGTVGGRRERTVADKKVNERKSSISSPPSSSKTQKQKTAPTLSLKGDPRPQPQRREWQEEVPREPSQDTWGLTYTIRAADHDHSTSSQQRSTPSTHLSTPQRDSEGGGGYGESWESSEVEEEVEEIAEEVEEEEEVGSASSRSVQVFQEIFKGRKADILSGMATSSPPSQSLGESLLSPPVSRADSEEGWAGCGYSSPALSLTPSPPSSSMKQKNSSRPHIKGKLPKREEYYETNFHGLDSSRNSNLEGAKGSISGPAQPSGSSASLRDSASGSAGGTSTSNISARIAALLVARPVSVPRLNSEWVSSCVPSEQPGTLSSMSDVLLSPPSSSVSG